MGENELLKIGELARRTGTTLRTIRYYEQLGLITHSARTKGGFHLYYPDDCQKILFIKNLQCLGTPLSLIRRLLERRRVARSGAEGAPEIIEILSGQLAEIEGRVAIYHQVQESIRQTLKILQSCKACPLKPSKEVCCRCDAVTSLKELPLPMQAMIAAS
ncbi:MAG TPA: MerR family transcriptional regulator [Candidatus Methylomirabilis sp.]|nr:MerR family transcriptional regulator [Candidatus Methylomirabilis sp.]